MSSFLTQCPHCQTSFRVTERQLAAADGLVRCGACLGIFSAAANRITLKQNLEDSAAEPVDESAELADEAAADTAASELAAEAADDSNAEPPTVSALPAATSSVDVHRTESSSETDSSDLLDEDFDIPLGDLNLDFDEAFGDDADEEEYEDEAEDEDEDEDEDADYDEFAEFEDFEEYVDSEANDEDQDEEEEAAAQDSEQAAELFEEYQDEEVVEDAAEDDSEEEFDDEFDAIAANVFEPSDTDALDDPFDDLVAAQAMVEQPAIPPRQTQDKADLRRYLAKIEDDEALEPLDDEVLDFEEEPLTLELAPRRSRTASVGLLLASILLAGTLMLQFMAANVDTLNRSAAFAPLLPYACRVLDCPVQERSQLELLVSERLLVRSHPRYAQALEVNLVFRNDASSSQPFPAIELGLRDTRNEPLANRVFQPAEYLPPELRTSEMPAQSSLQVTLEMADPGSNAVNYTLIFRKPG